MISVSSHDWSRTHARRRGRDAFRPLELDRYPSPATVTDLFGGWTAARRDAFAPLEQPTPDRNPGVLTDVHEDAAYQRRHR
jgi:hypothetical protein